MGVLNIDRPAEISAKGSLEHYLSRLFGKTLFSELERGKMGLHILPAERIGEARHTSASAHALGSFDAAVIGVGNNGIQPMSQS